MLLCALTGLLHVWPPSVDRRTTTAGRAPQRDRQHRQVDGSVGPERDDRVGSAVPGATGRLGDAADRLVVPARPAVGRPRHRDVDRTPVGVARVVCGRDRDVRVERVDRDIGLDDGVGLGAGPARDVLTGDLTLVGQDDSRGVRRGGRGERQAGGEHREQDNWDSTSHGGTSARSAGFGFSGLCHLACRGGRNYFGRSSTMRRILPIDRSTPSGSTTSTATLTPIVFLTRRAQLRHRRGARVGAARVRSALDPHGQLVQAVRCG